jgi:DNA polymerase-3 subunit gamma/tau
MTDALHLKYRPQSLNELVGQPYVVRTLSNAIKRNKINTAYLFAGTRGTGKTSTARIFAMSLNCSQIDLNLVFRHLEQEPSGSKSLLYKD